MMMMIETVVIMLLVITKDHTFPRAAEFRAEPRNLPFARNFRISAELHRH